MHVFVTRAIPDVGLELLRQHFSVEIWRSRQPPSQDQILTKAAECEGIVTLLSDQISKEIIQGLPKLRAISQYAVGYDNIDIMAATKRGIIVTNTPDVLTETTADLTWALILSAARRVVEADRYVREGKWEVAWEPQMLLGQDIYGSTLGIIGLGRIGAAVAMRAQGFGMRVLYHSRSETEATARVEREIAAERVDLSTLLKEADIVTLHVPLTETTTHMIDAQRIELMKPNAILVNTSRGPVIDQSALSEALKRKRIRAAGLDVFENEPIEEDSALLQLDNIVLLPHIGSASINTRSKMAMMCAENLICALQGKMPPNIVNAEVIQ